MQRFQSHHLKVSAKQLTTKYMDSSGLNVGDFFRDDSGSYWLVIDFDLYSGYFYKSICVKGGRLGEVSGWRNDGDMFKCTNPYGKDVIFSTTATDSGWLKGEEVAVPKTKTTIQEDLKRIKNNE